MALHWNIKNCAHSSCWDSEGNMTTTCEAMIWATMVVGINEITEQNIHEFAYRLEFDRRLVSTFRNIDNKPVTVESLRPFIGLKTNASSWTRLQFEKKTCKFFHGIYIKENTND